MSLKQYTNAGTLFCLASLFLLSACKKPQTIPEKTVYTANYGSVTISGFVYKTVAIGSQTWTTDNYGGVGGGVSGMYHQFAAHEVVLPTGWRLPSIADFNKLTGNVSTKKDANGNNIAGPGDGLDRLMRTNINYSPSFFFNGDLTGYETYNGPVYTHDLNVAGYYMASDDTPDRYVTDAYVYKLNKDFAGIVYIHRADSAVCASVRFVKDN